MDANKTETLTAYIARLAADRGTYHTEDKHEAHTVAARHSGRVVFVGSRDEPLWAVRF
jgi:hypothetical protein